MGTLHENLRIFMVVSHLILVAMRNVGDKRSRGNQNVHLMLRTFFLSKIVPFMR